MIRSVALWALEVAWPFVPLAMFIAGVATMDEAILVYVALIYVDFCRERFYSVEDGENE